MVLEDAALGHLCAAVPVRADHGQLVQQPGEDKTSVDISCIIISNNGAAGNFGCSRGLDQGDNQSWSLLEQLGQH